MEYEQIAIIHDPFYDDVMKATQIVRDFIISRERILYGGTAIDYALRLKGEKIYPDDRLDAPDFDFFSPTHIEDAYELADILYKAGWKEAHAKYGVHITTMRVSISGAYFVADLSYIPNELFTKLPYIVYDQMKCIHPFFQRIDQHSALNIPYDNPPMEVIFHRWKKDIERFNILADAYPTPEPKDVISLSEFRLPKSFKKHVFTGFAAYGFIYREFAQAARDAAVDFAGPIIPSGITVTDDEIIFRCLDSVEFISINPEKIEESLIEVTRYRPVINLLYARSTGKYKKTPVTIYNTYGKLISINSTYIDSAYRFINIQGLLRQFMAMYQYSLLIGASEKISNTYLAYYNSLLYMIKTLPYKKDNVTNPSVITYGSDNISVGQTIHLARMYTERDGVEMPAVPTNYYPERAKGRPHPVVNIESMEFFLVDGRIIK